MFEEHSHTFLSGWGKEEEGEEGGVEEKGEGEEELASQSNICKTAEPP